MAVVLSVTPLDTSCQYTAVFSGPDLQQLREESKLDLIGRMINAFGLRFNELKFGPESPSNRLISFSKFYNPSFLDVSYGVEEVSASLRNPGSEDQLLDLFGKLSDLFSHLSVSVQRMILQQHCKSNGDTVSYLQTVSPYAPEAFSGLLDGRGVTYYLNVPDHNMLSHITVANSLFVQDGLFLYVQIEFSPNKYAFREAFRIANEHGRLVFTGLGLIVEGA